jgi:DNA modification methylase
MLKPYYEHGGITIYHGDCREILPEIPHVDLTLTDPPYGIRADEAAHKNHGKWGWKDYGESTWDRERPTKTSDAKIIIRNAILYYARG